MNLMEFTAGVLVGVFENEKSFGGNDRYGKCLGAVWDTRFGLVSMFLLNR